MGRSSVINIVMNMRDLIKLVEASQDWGMLYHVSPLENMESISKHGLDPRFGRVSSSIYLAADPYHALGYDGHHDQKDSVLLE